MAAPASGGAAAPAAPGAPAYTMRELRPRSAPYAVCVFVLNEGPRITAQLRKMAPLADAVDIIIADGGSTDGVFTDDLLRACGVNALLIKTGPGKLSAQMRMAMDFVLRRDYAGMICIDGNDKDDPAAIPDFARALDAGFDHIQGSRYVPGGRGINTPWSRHWGVRILHAPLISWAAGVRYTDTTNGFRAYSARFLRDPRVLPLREVFETYELHYYLAIRAGELGFRVCELPVTRAYPKGEPVPTKISPLKGNARILRILWRAARHEFDPPPEKI